MGVGTWGVGTWGVGTWGQVHGGQVGVLQDSCLHPEAPLGHRVRALPLLVTLSRRGRATGRSYIESGVKSWDT